MRSTRCCVAVRRLIVEPGNEVRTPMDSCQLLPREPQSSLINRSVTFFRQWRQGGLAARLTPIVLMSSSVLTLEPISSRRRDLVDHSRYKGQRFRQIAGSSIVQQHLAVPVRRVRGD